MNPVTAPKTKEERDAEFAKLFANVAPADRKQLTVVELLQPYREQIVQKHKEGYSLRQIAEIIQRQPVGIKASAPTIMKLIGGRSRKRRKAKVSGVVNAADAAANPAR
jgi:DNA-binding NarL/FixJ family response regulator